jgi:hypothetical protein
MVTGEREGDEREKGQRPGREEGIGSQPAGEAGGRDWGLGEAKGGTIVRTIDCLNIGLHDFGR